MQWRYKHGNSPPDMEYLVLLFLVFVPLTAMSVYKYRKDKPPYRVQLVASAIALVFWGGALVGVVGGLFQVYGAFFYSQLPRAALGVALVIAGGCSAYFGHCLIRWVERGFAPAPPSEAPTDLPPGQVAPERWSTPAKIGVLAACAVAVILFFLAPSVARFFQASAAQGAQVLRWLAWAALAGAAIAVWRAPSLRLAAGWLGLVIPPAAWFASGLHEWAGVLLVFLGPLYVLLCVVPMLLHGRRRWLARRTSGAPGSAS